MSDQPAVSVTLTARHATALMVAALAWARTISIILEHEDHRVECAPGEIIDAVQSLSDQVAKQLVDMSDLIAAITRDIEML